MNKNIFAVCDLEAEYATNFMNYLNQKKNIPFDIQAFSSLEALVEYGRNHHIELLLISGRALRKEICELGIGKIIILSEGNHIPAMEEYPSVYKYQATSEVVREVMAFYGEEKTMLPSAYPIWKKSTEIIGIYSPVQRCLKTSFALTIGQVLAKEKSVLFLSFEGYSGFEELLHKKFPHSLSDILYYIKQDSRNLILRMNSVVQTINNMDFIPPVQAPGDILNASWEDIQILLQEITLHSSYETLVIDMGNGVQDVFPLLEQCDRIYMPVLDDVVSEGKIRQFENLLKAWDYAQILPKIEKLHLPFPMVPLSSDTYIEQLPFSDLGNYVKGMEI